MAHFKFDHWECPVCGWIVSDCEYLSIMCDPECPGCGVKQYSEFQFVKGTLDTADPSG